MRFNRVLTLQSYADFVTLGRINLIENNPALEGIEFSHICIIDYKRGSTRMKEWERLEAKTASHNELEPLLIEIIYGEFKDSLLSRIEDFNPDLLVVHSGTFFVWLPAVIVRMITQIRLEYPDLICALEDRNKWLSRIMSEDDPFLVRSHQWLRRIMSDDDPLPDHWDLSSRRRLRDELSHNFVEDPEVETILREIF